MYGILISAFNTILGFLLKKVIVQFCVLFALYFVIQTVIPPLLTTRQSRGLMIAD